MGKGHFSALFSGSKRCFNCRCYIQNHLSSSNCLVSGKLKSVNFKSYFWRVFFLHLFIYLCVGVWYYVCMFICICECMYAPEPQSTWGDWRINCGYKFYPHIRCILGLNYGSQPCQKTPHSGLSHLTNPPKANANFIPHTICHCSDMNS